MGGHDYHESSCGSDVVSFPCSSRMVWCRAEAWLLLLDPVLLLGSAESSGHLNSLRAVWNTFPDLCASGTRLSARGSYSGRADWSSLCCDACSQPPLRWL